MLIFNLIISHNERSLVLLGNSGSELPLLAGQNVALMRLLSVFFYFKLGSP